jgi:tetratricopeptide (TPR) repeat protein
MKSFRKVPRGIALSFGLAVVVAISAVVLHRRTAYLSPVSDGPRRPASNEDDDRALDTEPRFTGLGKYHRTITTRSRLAQYYFDQGLAFFYGFNADEASKSFEAAAVADPECAMAHWGVALSNGPLLNNRDVSPRDAMRAFRALVDAQAFARRCTATERALIQALATRIHDRPRSNRAQVDLAYSADMRGVWRRFPDDADVGALAADALLNLHRWDYWTHDGKPRDGTQEAIGILNSVLRANPDHPYALHLLVHAVEGSPNPEVALPAADRLRRMTPGLSHLLHMPSHIDVRLGHWEAALICNERAIAAERDYRRITDIPDTPRNLGMYLHNHCMLAYCAMMKGQRDRTAEVIHEMFSAISAQQGNESVRDLNFYQIVAYEAHLRFGDWDEMIAEPEPSVCLPVARAFWNFGRGIAFAAKKDLLRAKAAQRELLISRASVPQESRLPWNSARRIMDVAEKMLEGEILYREGESVSAFVSLREAASREDSLDYGEPPDWMMPVRHALGATLLDSARYADAEGVYRADLAQHPENGWSLYGLARSLKLQGKKEQAAVVLSRFDAAWRDADFRISSSCCCLPERDIAVQRDP